MFCSALVLMGALDWLTTTVGIMFFGATEVNPLLSGLTQSSMLLFSTVKLSAVAITGAAFYKAMDTGFTGQNSMFTARFVYAGYGVAFLALTTLVANNIIATVLHF